MMDQDNNTQPEFVTCSLCHAAFTEVWGTRQAHRCAASAAGEDYGRVKATDIIGHFGSVKYDMVHLTWIGEPEITADTDPICDQCIDDRVATNRLRIVQTDEDTVGALSE